MTQGPFEAICSGVMGRLAQNTSSPARARAPYYVYGRKAFDASDGSPPNVRAKKVDFSFEQSLDRGGYGVSGSLLAWRQGIAWRVWGADEYEAHTEASSLLKAINDQVFDGFFSLAEVAGTWLPDDSDRDWRGEMVEFTTYIPVGVANSASLLVTVLTASFWVSSSLTGSFTDYPDFEPEGLWTPWVSGSTTSSL